MSRWYWLLLVPLAAATPAQESVPTLPPEQERALKASIADLCSDSFDRRQDAEGKLREATPSALPLLRAALRATDDIEARLRLAQVMSRLAWRDFKAFPKQPVSFTLNSEPGRKALSAFGDVAPTVCELFPLILTAPTPVTLMVKNMPADSAMRWLVCVSRLEAQRPRVSIQRRYDAQGTGMDAAKLAVLLSEKVFARELLQPQASVEAKDNELVITETPEGQETIKDFLDLLRKPIPPGGVVASESDSWRQAVVEQLERQRVSVECKQTTLAEAIARLQKFTDVTLISDPEAATPLDLKLADVSLAAALRWLARCSDTTFALYDHAAFLGKSADERDRQCRIHDVADIKNPAGQEVRFPDVVQVLQTRTFVFMDLEHGFCLEEDGGRLIVRHSLDYHELISGGLTSLREFLAQVRDVEPDGKPPPKPLELTRVPGHPKRLPPRTEEPRKKALRKKLEKEVSFEFVDTPLLETLDFIRRECKVNLVVDPAIVDAGGDSPINLRVKEMRAELALEWILRLAEVDYYLRDEAVFVTKRCNLTDGTVAWMCYVRDLTSVVPPHDLASIVTEFMRPCEWAAVLGTSLEERGGILFVRQRPEVQAMLQEMLDHIRLHYEDPVCYPIRATQKHADEDAKARWGSRPRKVFVDIKNMPLLEALTTLKEKAGLSWKLDETVAKAELPAVTLKADNEDEEEVLAKILRPMRISFANYNGHWLIGREEFIKAEQTECAIYNLTDLSEQQCAALLREAKEIAPNETGEYDTFPRDVRLYGKRLLVTHSFAFHEVVARRLAELRKPK